MKTDPGNRLEPIEAASVDELRSLQLDRLRATLAHTYQNSPFYRARFDEACVHPSDLRALSDLSKFPFTHKQDLRECYPFGMLAVPESEVARVHASSGTTGQPTVVCYSQRDLEMWATVMARSIRAAGGRPGDRVHVAYNYGLFTGGLGAHYGAEKLGCTVIPMSGGQTEKQVMMLRDLRADIIMVTPSYMLNICDEMERQGMDPRELPLRIGIFGAEPWTNAMRASMEQRLGIDALDIYGLSEVIGGGVSQECIETKDGLTIWEDHFYPEIIDPDTGEVLPDGEQGELVFTSLTKEAMPIIRYRTRDLTRLLPGSARSMRRMDKITGRSDDMLIIRGVNMFPAQIEEQILQIPQLCPHYHLVVSREGNMDSLEVRVELARGVHASQRERCAVELSRRIKSVVGVSALVRAVDFGSLPRSEGKARRITDNRNLH